jgi:hypothetical protein
MDVSELRKRILYALDDARRQSVVRRSVVDAASSAYDGFLEKIAVPMFRQAASVLVAAGHPFAAHTPGGSVRLVSEHAPETFLELSLDVRPDDPVVVGRVSLTRGRHGHLLDERPIAPGKSVAALTEEDLSAFLTTEIPRLVMKP